MQVRVQSLPFDPYAAVLDYQQQYLPAGQYGAAVTFVGYLRDFNEGQSVSAMRLEYYPGMTERQITRVCEEAVAKWSIDDVLVVHRCGELAPADPIVLVAVWSAHRADGFDACRYIINYLKERAPFWKQETTPQGNVWAESNTKDFGVRD